MTTAVLVGRPNVGKSTLFNKLTRTRAALVDDREGVTRDWIERPWEIRGAGVIQLRDLCGFRELEDDAVLQQAQAAMLHQLQDADLLVLVIDARQGVTEADRWISRQVRQAGKPVVLVANKTEGESAELAAYSASELGWSPVLVSAEHSLGLAEIEEAATEELRHVDFDEVSDIDLKLTILGKPNAGKSTLLNALIGEQRATVTDVAGTTRDPVDAVAEIAGFRTLIVDTAGIRRRRSITDQLEAATVSRSIDAIDAADVVLYLMDAEYGITQQDQLLLSRVATAGKGLLLLYSKWDLVEEGDTAFKHLQLERERLLPFVTFAPVLTLSAHTGHNMKKIEAWVERLVHELDREIPTSELNRMIREVLEHSPPPAVQIRTSRRRKQHKRLKVYYATQSGTRPLRFKLFANVPPKELPDAYQRFLVRRLREEFDIQHVPILLHFETKRTNGS